MIVSIQGGGEDGKRQRTWPRRLEYIESPYPFGQRLQSDFERTGIGGIFKTSTVASCLVFPQRRDGFEDWKRQPTAQEWCQRSRMWLNELIDAMMPKAILTYGKAPFEELTGQPKRKGELAESDYCGVPVIVCGHLMRWATRKERELALRKLPIG